MSATTGGSMAAGDEAGRPGATDTVAIVGMACRFPGAGGTGEFWRNLRAGVESIRTFTEDELAAAGVEPSLMRRTEYVRAGAPLAGADRFDAAFFGYTPREAELLDPQQRIFLECAWSALEEAGYNPLEVPGATGVFAGSGINTYLLRQIAPHAAARESAGDFSVMLANDKDFLPTRVAYKLNLRGPAVAVQTACSTSLVAVHLAVQSLLAGECDTALAGGVSIRFPQDAGYLHQEGMILSPDGHCRAFDARAAGTVGGNGAGVVVLKRLADAQAAGDTIRAVIRGSAVNNDGAGKVGYTAPSVEGQEAVIAEALAVAGVAADSIGYVEAHGTGTRLGDPVEVAALTRAFRRSTDLRQFCALGSVKTNLGHLDSAAGVAGLIKAVLMLQNGEIPPSLHFTAPNPAVDFAASPFRVAARLEAWPRGAQPRRAGVSSFGIGGTNAHVVLEEAPPQDPGAADEGPQLIILSAPTASGLAAASRNLAAALDSGQAPLADIAYTLAHGRREFAHRRWLVARTAAEAAGLLRESPSAEGAPAAALAEAGRAWAAGRPAPAAATGTRRLRVPLPTYPFEGDRHWLEAPSGRRPDLADWCYVPAWHRLPAPPSLPAATEGTWVIFGSGLGERLAERLRTLGATVVAGPAEDYAATLGRARAAGHRPRWLVHTGRVGSRGADGLSDMLALGQALCAAELAPGARLTVAADGLCVLPGETNLRPEQALLLGPVRVLPRELPALAARAVDVGSSAGGDQEEALLAEARRDGFEAVSVLRGSQRWAPAAVPVRLEAACAPPRAGGVYLITGGLSGIGAVLAEDLARRCGARLILIGRTALPPREQWAAWTAAHPGDDAVSARLRRVQAIEAAGGKVRIGCADAADEAQMRAVIAAAEREFGPVRGVVHAAGLPGGGAIARRAASDAAAVLAPKVEGARVLSRIFAGAKLDFFVLMSSLSAQRGEFGQADYVSANAFLDAFAQEQRALGVPAVAIAWDAWRDTGMAARLASVPGLAAWAAGRRPRQIADGEGAEIFHRAIAAGVPQVMVSTGDWVQQGGAGEGGPGRRENPAMPAAQARPATIPYAAPTTELEREMAAIWEELLGVTPVGSQDDFFELGGHSLLAAQVMARLRERWGAVLTLPEFFDSPTVAGLARIVSAAAPAGASEPEPVPAARSAPLPLSYQQQALWLLDRVEGGSAGMNELGAQTIRGALDVPTLRRSLTEVVRRHEVLRTRFTERAGEPWQEIGPPTAIDLPLLDWSDRPAGAQEPALRELAAELVALPFDLAQGPLLRAVLVRRGAGHHVLLVVVHHIAFDGWSGGIFFREMAAVYSAWAQGLEPELGPLALQYADYAVWQRAALQGGRREKLEQFWREQLRGPLPQLALPLDRPRPAVAAGRGEKHRIVIEAALTGRLEELGRAHGASLFMTLLAGYGALLGRYCGQEDIVVGCPAANRAHRKVEPLIGFFINPLPLRLDLRGDPTFAGLLERVRRTALAAAGHQALPFELIVEAVRPPRSPGRHAIFQTTLVHQNAAPTLPAVPGLAVDPLEFSAGPARTDLDLYLWEGGGGLSGYFIFDLALFDPPTIARLAQRWRRLLESAAARPDAPLSSLRSDPAPALPALARRAATA